MKYILKALTLFFQNGVEDLQFFCGRREMDRKVLLSKTVFHAAEKLGLSFDQLAMILSIEKSSMNQNNMTLDPASKPGQKALLLIQIFQSLYVLNGGDIELIQYFMNSQNHITSGVPIQQVQSENGLVIVHECLQALLIK
jgi:hypothetical protein